MTLTTQTNSRLVAKIPRSSTITDICLISVKSGLATKKNTKHSSLGRIAIYIGRREDRREFVVPERMTTDRSIEGIGPVTKVRHRLMCGGKISDYVNSDLIALAGIPTVVLMWHQRPQGDYPAATVTLNPGYLHKISWPEAEYLYELPIENARSVASFGANIGFKTLQMVEQSSQPIPNDVREAFLDAVRLYDDWKSGGPERLVSFRKVKRISMTGMCELILSYRNEPLPENVHNDLWKLMDETGVNLKLELTADPSYRTGAQCLLKLIESHRRQAAAVASFLGATLEPRKRHF